MLKILKFSLATILLLMFTQSVFALLPPYYQSTKEIIAILENPEVVKKVASPYPIKSITKTDSGYSIAIEDCQLEVKVVYLPPEKGFVGPAKFEIKPEEKVCRKKLEDQD